MYSSVQQTTDEPQTHVADMEAMCNMLPGHTGGRQHELSGQWLQNKLEGPPAKKQVA